MLSQFANHYLSLLTICQMRLTLVHTLLKVRCVLFGLFSWFCCTRHMTASQKKKYNFHFVFIMVHLANILWKFSNGQNLMKMQLGVVTQLRAHTEVKSLTTSYGHHSRHHGNEDDNNRKIFTFITFHGA